MKKLIDKINWGKNDNGLLPAIIQDTKTKQILMLGYMNQEALQKTLETKRVWFFSRSKQRLWMKGETSRNYLNLTNIKIDCDNDTLLITASPAGPTCHTKQYSCFDETKKIDILKELFSVIEERKKSMPQDSYTTTLLKEGVNKITEKIEEESDEVIKAAKYETKQRVIEETVDLLYHLFVLLVGKDIPLDTILQEMKKRRS